MMVHAPTFGIHVHVAVVSCYPWRYEVHNTFKESVRQDNCLLSRVATLAHALRSPTKVTGSVYTPPSSNAFCPCPHFTCPKKIDRTPRNSMHPTYCRKLSKHPLCLWFDIDVNEATTYKHIRLKPTFNHFFMGMPALSKCSHNGGTGNQYTHKSNRFSPHPLRLHLLK
jgi:hypothetical protein